MSNFGVPDISSFSRLSRQIADIKARANTTRTEAVTGRISDVTAAVKGDNGGVNLLHKAVDDARAFQYNLSLAENRAQRSQSVLSFVGSHGARIGSEALAALGRDDPSTMRVIAEDAKTALQSIFASLNTTEGGRALFSGDVADRSPLTSSEQMLSDVSAILAGSVDKADADAQLDAYFNDPAGGFATSIYDGGAGRAPKVEIAEGVRIDVAVKADDPAIKDLLRSLAVTASSESVTNGERSQILESNFSKAISANAMLIEVRGILGVNESRISAAKANHEAEEVALTTLLNAKSARDPYEAASELQLLESQLESAYLLTARIARLSIAEYLR